MKKIILEDVKYINIKEVCAHIVEMSDMEI